MEASSDPSAQMPALGELRAFVAVAEELHFARAARRIGLAPPSLSQAIRRLELTLRAVLLVRTPRSVSLTEAGIALLPRARDILIRVEAAQAALHRDDDAGTLTVGIASNGFAELTAPVMSAFRRAHPGVRVVLRDVTERLAPVMSGEVDIALVRPPVVEQLDPGIRFIEVVDEPRVALLPAGHRMADATAISIADLSEESFVEVGPGRARITDFWAATESLGGERPRMGGEAFTVGGVLQSVAYLGDVITSIPSVLRFFHVPGIVGVPLVDVGPATMAVCARAGDDRPLTRDFIDAASTVAAGAIDLVPGARMIPTDRREAAAL
jgi:DNA-binding transcriptional LysR family regulator